MTRKILKISLFLILFASLIYWMKYYNNNSFNKEMDLLVLNGKIANKYLDKQDHNRPKLTILDNKDSLTLDLTNESSGLFDYIQIGDSIYKIKNKLDVRIFNSNRDSTFLLSF